MKWPGGWLWKRWSYWGSHPRTTVKNESGTHEFPCFSVEEKHIYIYIYIYMHICVYIYIYIYIYRERERERERD